MTRLWLATSYALLLGCCAVAACQAADAPVAHDAALDLEALVGIKWYSLSVLGSKVGYVSMQTELGEIDGNRVLIERNVLRLVMRVGRERIDSEFNERRVYEAQPPYRLMSAESEERSRKGRETVRVERDGDEFAVTRVVGGLTTRKRMPASRETIGDRCAVGDLIRGGPEPGDSRTYLTFNLSRLETEERTATVTDVLEEEWQGELQRVYLVRIDGGDATQTAHYLADGTVVLSEFGGALEIRLEDEKEAKRLPRTRDQLQIRRELAVEGLDVDGHRIERLTIEIEGMPPEVVPESATQRVHRRDDGVLVLTLTASALPEAPSLSAEGRERLAADLEATDEYQSEHRVIRRRAARIVGEEADPLEQVRAINHWVYANIRGAEFRDYKTALDVLRHRQGDCTEHELLFTALCRAAGIPARPVEGFVYSGPSERTFAVHRWAQVYVGSWVDVDPTLDQVPADATHIALDVEGENWYAFLKAFDSLRIKVAEVEAKPASE